MNNKMKIMFLVLIFSFNFFSSNVLANTRTELSLLKEITAIPKDDNFSLPVNRMEALTAIMKIIGVTEEENEKRKHSEYVYRDFRDIYNLKNEGYILYAWEEELAFGEYIDGETYSKLCFNPYRKITYEELLMYMMRCLYDIPNETIFVKQCKLVKEDKEEALKMAEEIGLLKLEDSFYNDLKEPVGRENYYELLKRFLNQKRYCYYSVYFSENGYYCYIAKDEDRSITYLEHLEQIVENK